MEFKLKDWKKALLQALSYQLVADYVYIVIYLKYRNLIDQELIKNNGVGLIIANSRRYEILIKPRKNTINDENLKRRIKKKYNN